MRYNDEQIQDNIEAGIIENGRPMRIGRINCCSRLKGRSLVLDEIGRIIARRSNAPVRPAGGKEKSSECPISRRESPQGSVHRDENKMLGG